jgi:1,2-diacylglycerol 3-alpha-glucosyltransferase
MNILFVSDTYYPHVNGVYHFVCRIAPLLRTRGHAVAVIAPAEGYKFTRKPIDTIDVYGMPSLPMLLYPGMRFPVRLGLRARVRKVIRIFKPDVIHVQDHFLLSREVIRLSRQLGIPVIGTNHFMPENLTAYLPAGKLRKLAADKMWCKFSKVFNQVSLVTTPTETAARLIRPRLNVEVVAVSSGIDLQRFAPCGNVTDIRLKYGIPPGPTLLFVGRLDPEKKLEQVLHAVKLSAAFAQYSLVVVGRGIRAAALREQARQLHIDDRVIFTGFVPEDDLPFIYRACRCFIIASEAELLSLATLQALASGLPVIAVNAGALHELVRDKINGYLFAQGDVAAMSRHIMEIMTNDRLWRDMSKMSLEIAPLHDLKHAADIFESIYEEECCNWKLADRSENGDGGEVRPTTPNLA